ncbi:MAG TPA: hypothetical protein VFV08_13650, partial [Puia sp.]|nr:hypothetical protein [Puia sp.]
MISKSMPALSIAQLLQLGQTRIYILILFLFCLLSLKSRAQSIEEAKTADSLFSGTWKGESLCQVKESPCHDEHVVYYISSVDKNLNLEMKANKIVNGSELEMGTIQFHYDKKLNAIISLPETRGVWKFIREGDHLKGNLIYNNQ